MKLASFDIFDTTLIRRCGKPENIFYLMAERLYPEDEIQRDLFILWRLSVENRVKNKLNREVKLEDIYEDDELLAFVEYSPNYIYNLEKEIESENLIVNPEIRNVINQKRRKGFTICFISDMYLDSHFLKDVLLREGCCVEEDKIYVSSEWNERKSTGGLYDCVRKEFSPTQWVHHGDNEYSDVRIAKRKGVKAYKVDTDYNAIEKKILKLCDNVRDRYQLSLLVSYSRLLRITNNNELFNSFASDFVAPAYVSYIKYICDVVKTKDIKRIYFLSRDSYVLMKGMECIESVDTELKYLFVSRKSLLLPYLVETTKEQYLNIIDRNTVYRKYVDVLLDKLGFSRDELKAYGVEFDYNHIATREQEKDFLNKLFESDFTQVLHAKAEVEYNLLCDYFRQEGLFEGDVLLVDVGWLGTSRLMINYILQRQLASTTLFAYFGIRDDVYLRSCGDFVSYFKKGQLSSEATILLENYFSSSPYPTTIGYNKDASGFISPKFVKNQGFAETEITKANVEIVQSFVTLLNKKDFVTKDVYYLWADVTLKSLLNLDVDMNLMALTYCGEFDGRAFVRKLSFKDIFLLICCGKHITSLDRISVYITFGKFLRKYILRAYNFVHALKRKIFLRYVYR